MTLQGKIAVVTGGAGGIGSAISRRLAAEGATVIITYSKSRDKAEAVLKTLAGSGHQTVCAPVDESAAQADLARLIEATYGTLDLLVNNAGITQPVPHDDLDALSDDLIDQILRVNVRGVLASIRAMKPLLMTQGGGLIVNISSIAARTAVGSNIAYCASKAALDNLTMSLARAFAPSVRVVSVSPGWVNGEYAQRMPPELIQRQLNQTPLGRIAEAEDVANAVYAVATQLTFTTGTIIAVDGGRPLS